MAEAQAGSRWRFLYTPRWVAWHVFVVASVVGMLALGEWQLHRAEAGNGLSWAYTFEWPIFAVFVVVFWVKTIRDELRPAAAADQALRDVGVPGGRPAAGGDGAGQAPGEDAGDADRELAAYNAYLARLSKEVKGHGRWHGIR